MSMNFSRRGFKSALMTVAGGLCIGVVSLPASAQGGDTGLPPATIEAMQRTARQLSRGITVELTDARLEDIVQFITDYSGANIRAMWLDDRSSEGLDKDMEVSVSVENVRVIDFIEEVMEQASSDFSPATWQFAENGRGIQIGPRARLNEKNYLKAYDVNDLLFQLPDFDNAPTLDLDQVLNQGQQGGSGSSGSIFQDDNDGELEIRTTEELAQELIDILIETVEPDQWRDNGGDGGTIRFYSGFLLINAPNYIHRQLGGLPFEFTDAPIND